MGNTYRRERSYDDHGNSRKHKKLVNQQVDKKQNKNKNFIYFDEDEEFEEYEFNDDEYFDEDDVELDINQKS